VSKRVGRQVAEGRPAARITRPLREFLDTEVAGGMVLLVAVVIALLWANSPWQRSYEVLWGTPIRLSIGEFVLENDLRHWINDGLMAIFFFVVGLEIKREVARGELSTARTAVLPAMAALGGMALPALIFVAMNTGEAARGWGIPMATDIAFALGALALVGSKAPQSLRVLLLSLAIVDDVGAIVVIAIFYSEGIQWVWIAAALAGMGLILLVRMLRVWWIPLYVALGSVVWFATLEAGIHATIAGVAIGLLTPARPLSEGELRDSPLHRDGRTEEDDDLTAEQATMDRLRIRASVPVTDHLEHLLHPWTSFLVLPLFALANAGVALSLDDIGDGVTSPVTLGIVAGLVVGKLLGISGFSWLSARLGAKLPRGVGWPQVMGVGGLAGIGFTMSLFISNLAFEGTDLQNQAKLGILAGSVLAASVGALIIRASTRHR
jgi:NhaA family Na+:H+ antiporter